MATSSRTSLDRSSVHSRERMDVDDMIEPISCPSIPRSSITWTVVGIRKGLLVYLSVYIYIYIYLVLFILLLLFFFFFAVMAFGVLLRIDYLMAAMTHFAAMWLIFIGWGVSFPVKTLSVFPHFPRQNLLIFWPFHFSFPHLLCDWFL